MTGYAAVVLLSIYLGGTMVLQDVWEPKHGVSLMVREGFKIIAVIGLVGSLLLGYLADHTFRRFFFGYLVAYAFCLSIALGALFIGSLPGGSLMGMLQRLAAWAREPRVLLRRFASAQEEVAIAGNGNGIEPHADGLAASEFGERVIEETRLERAGS